jgi:hypothetical protein
VQRNFRNLFSPSLVTRRHLLHLIDISFVLALLLHLTLLSRFLPESTYYESHSDLCCCRGRHLFTPCSRSPPPVSHSLLYSGLLCLKTLPVPIPPPSTPDPRTMIPSGRCHAVSLPRKQCILCRGFRLVVARLLRIHLRKGGQLRGILRNGSLGT